MLGEFVLVCFVYTFFPPPKKMGKVRQTRTHSLLAKALEPSLAEALLTASNRYLTALWKIASATRGQYLGT